MACVRVRVVPRAPGDEGREVLRVGDRCGVDPVEKAAKARHRHAFLRTRRNVKFKHVMMRQNV